MNLPPHAFDHRMPKPLKVPSKDKLAWLAENVIELKKTPEDVYLRFFFVGAKGQQFIGLIHSTSLDNAIIRAMYGIWHPQAWDWNWSEDPPRKGWKPEVEPSEPWSPFFETPQGCGYYRKHDNDT